MNTIISYLMGVVLYVIAFFLPHQTEATSISLPLKIEKKQEVLPEINFTFNKGKLECIEKKSQI